MPDPAVWPVTGARARMPGLAHPEDERPLFMRGACNWRPLAVPARARVPPGMRSWIETPGSLTGRMRRCCGPDFSVVVLCARWRRPWRDETARLRLRPQRRAWLREVLLCNGDTPWIYARSIIPASTLRGPLRRLCQLGGTPLGAVLFGRYPLHRGPIEVASLGAHDRLRHRAAVHTTERPHWARRSVFHAGDRGLLVTEVFLPALAAWQEAHATPWN